MEDYVDFILNNTQIGVFVCDSKGIIRYMNHTFARMFKIDISSAPGRKITRYFPDSKIFNVLKTGKSDKGVSYRFKGKDALVYRTPIKKNKEIIGVMVEVIFNDISDCLITLKKVKNKLEYYKRRVHELPGSIFSLDDIIGNSEIMMNLKEKIRKFAKSSQPVLICGESGVGKELVAHSIHSCSLRASEVFLKINCASIPRNLLESELFGYEEGTFTNARKGGKIGKFELADRGALFLDEIAELPLPMQAKLLRVIETKEIEKLGKSLPVYSDFRLITATNKDLEKAVAGKKFRDDFFHRLNILVLNVPPLRERIEDIADIAEYLLRHIEDIPACSEIKCSRKVIELYRAYHWPGNIRELKNSLIYAVISLENGQDKIEPHHLPPAFQKYSIERSNRYSENMHSLRHNREASEKKVIISALKKTRQNKVRASKLLGISRNELYRKMKKYELMKII